ncbi:MAG: DUF1365 domain-containing protein [Acidimicrobiia bacterium]|nr:DUF1365 domain-containing protein [Acidimicrobiia bacterium]
MTRSAIYRGRVSHTRLRPFRHRFEYRVYYLLLDVDEIDHLTRRLRWFSRNRFNLLGIADRDHGDGAGLREWADRTLETAGITADRIAVLAFPRVLGYVFDPISVWYAWRDDELVGVVHEVHNTFGDRHAYVVPVTDDLRHGFDKALHVSPFMDMSSRYEFAMTLPGERLTIGIRQHDDDGPLFRASLRLRREPLTDRTLLRMFVSHPLVTIKAIAAIHWQALRLWRRGARVHRRPEPREPKVSVIDPART